MKLGPILKVVVGALLLAVCASATWWVGIQIGKGAMGAGDSAAFRSAYTFDGSQLVGVCFLALVVMVTLQVVPSTGNKWLVLGAVAVGAGLLVDRSSTLTVVLLVLVTAGVDEVKNPVPQLIAAAAAGVLVALPSIADSRMSTGAAIGAAVLRGVFLFAPLIALPSHLEKHALKRLP